MNAIDLYAGVGGWSLGLALAGVRVLSAYELWPEAVDTYNANLSTSHKPVNLRTLQLKSLPQNVELIVGSPPCTQFSFSNRGGKGDLSEGLKDIIRFLEIVRFIRPRYWVLENVPRTAEIIKEGLSKQKHPLYRFKGLNAEIRILDFSLFGLPQSRRRCLVGCFPFQRLDEYSAVTQRRTLRNVISALGKIGPITDPVWGDRISSTDLTEHEPEPELNEEQLRINRQAKQFHPVYNDMSFPDRLDAPARTITATCTRVSRESIVIQAGRDAALRRLTVRERASLQGFPVGYQFFANSHSAKIKMIGNALPPTFSMLVGLAAQGIKATEVSHVLERTSSIVGQLCASRTAPSTPPDRVAHAYPVTRKFRSALPGLRFKSGMRFELANELDDVSPHWKVRFFYGSPKDIRTISLDSYLYRRVLCAKAFDPVRHRVEQELWALQSLKSKSFAFELQQVWTHRAAGIGPFAVVDALGNAARNVGRHLQHQDSRVLYRLVSRILRYQRDGKEVPEKVRLNAVAILAGFIVGSAFNKNRNKFIHPQSANRFEDRREKRIRDNGIALVSPSSAPVEKAPSSLSLLAQSLSAPQLKSRGVSRP
jgi:DNA (cytosine-5)-methyltransferase 1